MYIGRGEVGGWTDRQTKIQISGGMNPGVLDPPEHNLMGGRQKRWLEHGILDVHSHLHRT